MACELYTIQPYYTIVNLGGLYGSVVNIVDVWPQVIATGVVSIPLVYTITTQFGTALTIILPILFQFCYKYCYSDSRNLWVVMKAGGLEL